MRSFFVDFTFTCKICFLRSVKSVCAENSYATLGGDLELLYKYLLNRRSAMLQTHYSTISVLCSVSASPIASIKNKYLK